MAAEGKIRKYLKARVESYGGEVRAVSWLGRRNAPDVLCLFGGGRGHPFVETKAPGGKPTAAQAREHERMCAAGCVVLVMSTEQQIDEWLPPRA
jgi:hypothetical protein